MPIRTCIVCKSKDEKKNLIRIVANDDSSAIYDKTSKINKRGIYICNKKECIEGLLRLKNFSKINKINVDEESIKELVKNLGE